MHLVFYLLKQALQALYLWVEYMIEERHGEFLTNGQFICSLDHLVEVSAHP